MHSGVYFESVVNGIGKLVYHRYLRQKTLEINLIIVGMVILGVLILIAFLVRKNQKDKKKYNNFLNKDYKKAGEEDSDLDDDTC